MIAYVLLRVFLLLLLVAANAFFAAAEFSLVSVRDTRIQQLIDARRIGARIVQKLHRNLDEVVNGVQLGVTIVSLTLGWVGEPLLAHMMAFALLVDDRFVKVRPQHCDRRFLHPDHLLARDSGRTGAQVTGFAACRAGGAGGGGAHGRLPYADSSGALRHEPIGRLGIAHLRIAPDQARPGALAG